ncbi:putative fatty acyl-CoA reductase CG5065 [Manduca sexta]|uniref:putative fatty acyl-CoA reductase CG5065 n=1 Tax=Manduca sexta TaxID=7130 RepID=UPI0018909B2D|nr:putative fatty acyl-CoA reductase CG5065 [Manduca sexta]
MYFQVLIEKLLYTCTGIEKVFLLVRELKGLSPDQRMQQFLNNPLFQRLKDEKPKILNKLIPVNGNLSANNLGISEEDAETLIDEVSVVFHAAATVRFNDKMNVPMKVNFGGTMKMLELSKKMKNLEMFVHVSTAYAHISHLKDGVREVLYPPPATLDEVEDFITKYNDDEEMTNKYLNGRVNTYTFAKALAEHHVVKNKEHVPVIIVRPAAVTATIDAPTPGWSSNWQGVPRALYNVAMGYSRVTPGRHINVIDFIPVDYVVNLCIIAAAKSGRTNDVPVFNCSSSSVNPITWSKAYKWFTEDVVRRGKSK